MALVYAIIIVIANATVRDTIKFMLPVILEIYPITQCDNFDTIVFVFVHIFVFIFVFRFLSYCW